jgi:hypothetical protein
LFSPSRALLSGIQATLLLLADVSGAGVKEPAKKNEKRCEYFKNSGVPYGSRTRVAAVKEERITVIQRNSAAWVVLYRT